MILVRPTPNGQPAQLREFNDAERAAIRDYGNQEGIFDNLRDALKGAQRQLDNFGRGVGERTDQLREDAQRTIDGIREQIDNFRFPWEQSTNGDRSPAQSLAAEPSPVRTDQVAANTPNAPSTNGLSTLADSPAFRDVYAGIQQQDQRLGRTPDQHSLQLAAALTVEVERQRIAPPIEVAFDNSGTRAFAFEKNAARPEAQAYAHVEIAQAVHQPLAASEQRLVEARQLAAQTSPTESRGVDDPARSTPRLA
jgi:hypothetical protein